MLKKGEDQNLTPRSEKPQGSRLKLLPGKLESWALVEALKDMPSRSMDPGSDPVIDLRS